MKKKRALVDVDDVCANFIDKARATIELVTGRFVSLEATGAWDLFRPYAGAERKAIFAAIEREGWCYELEVILPALEGINQLRRSDVDVYFVTAPWHSRNWVYERTLWLMEHFGAPRDHIVHTNAKYLCVGDVLVDDKPEHCEKWQEHHPTGMAILWDTPQNQQSNFLPRGNAWDFVLECLEGPRH